MNKLPTIFLSYNPKSDFEETLAVRLHTIGAVHGFNMLLPDRYNNYDLVSAATKQRIFLSDYFILFSISNLSKKVAEEINLAFQHLNDKSKILVIYDKKKGKNIKGTDNCTEIYIDSRTENVQQILDKIISEVKIKETNQLVAQQKRDDNVLAGLLLAGLGLLVLGSLADGGKGK